MSTTIDQKVVEMRFDNQQFEKGIATSMNSIEKLEKSLDLRGATKGLENVESAARNCNMSGLSTAVDTVKTKFSALEVMGVTALMNITNSAVNAGKRIVSALTIDPVRSGFNEYELKMGSIQTMMSATGESLETVNGYLNELNEYSDKTIYSFSDMTQNIGKFTNAGVNLEDSVAAIKGIANVAAVSGANSNEASRAMYNFAQALSSGYVKLIDWKSIELANMGTVEFKEQLLEAAVAAKTLTKTGDGMYKTMDGKVVSATKNFNDSLQDQWMTSEVLIGTLKKYTDTSTEIGKKATDAATEVKTLSMLYDTLKESAQSGWAQTWEIIVGDFEEAKQFMTELSNIFGGLIGKQADSRNELLENWKVLGGRTALLDSIRNVFNGIASIVKPISEAFREIFPPMTAERLMGFTEGLKNLTARLTLSKDTSDKLKRTFKGLFAVIDIIRQVFVAVVGAIGKLLGPVGELGGGILGVTASFGDWLVRLNDVIKTSDVFAKVFGGIAGVIRNVFDIVKRVGQWLYTNLLEPMLGIADAALDMTSTITSAFGDMGSSIEGSSLFKVMRSIWDGITTIAKGIAKVFGSMAGGLFEKISNGDLKGFLDVLNSLITGGIGIGIIRLFKSLREGVDGFADIIGGLGGCLEGFQNKLNADALIRIAGAVAILSASLLVLSFVDSDKISDAISAITVLFTELMTAMAIFTKISTAGDAGIIGTVKSIFQMQTAANAIIKISAALLIMAIALRVVSGLDWDELAVGLTGIFGLTAMLVGAMKILGTGGKTVVRGATQMVILAAAIKILASVCRDLSSLSWNEMAKGLVGVGVLLAEISLFMRTAKFSGKSITTATGIVILSAAIKILASACEDFAGMSWGEIGKGLAAIAGLLAEIIIFTHLTGNAKQVISTGIALLAISAAIKIFASAARDIASLTWGEITKGLVAIAGALVAITLAMNLMPKNMIAKSIGIIAISAALLIISSALNSMGGMSWESIAKGLVSLGGALLILAAGLHLMKGTLGGSAALLIAVAALAILTPVLKSLGSMSWGAIAKGLIAIAGAFIIIGVAGYALSGVAPAIVLVAAAIALIGVAVLAAGVGLVAFGAGLSALAVGFTALVGSLGAVCTGIVSLVSAIITGVIKGIGDGIIAFCEVIIAGVPAIGEAIKILVFELCDVLLECLPVIVDTVLKLLISLMSSLVEYTPTLVDLLFQLLLDLLDGIAKNIPPLIQKVVDILMAIFTGALDAISNIDSESLIKGLAAVGLMAGIVAALSAIAPLIPGAMIGAVGMGLIAAELAVVLAALGALAQIPGLEWLIGEGGNFLQTIGTAIGQFIGGIIGGIGIGATDALPAMADNLSEFMKRVTPFIDGAKMIDASALDGVRNLISMVLLITGANLIEGLTSWLTGGSSMENFATEIGVLGSGLKSFSDNVAGISPESVAAATEAAKALADMASTIPNQGGIISWFSGDNGVAAFAEQLPVLGMGLRGFSTAVLGIVPENIIAAATAAKALADMAATIPNQGGVVSWFSGDNGVAAFAEQLPVLGHGLLGFSKATIGIVPENIVAAASAAKALADMVAIIPNQGGVVSWFAGDNSVSTFASELPILGSGLKGFSDSVAGIVPENIVAVANAAKSLAEMTTYLPNEGGVASWFTGESSISKFGAELISLGTGLKGFSVATAGINPETIVATSNAAKALAEMTGYIPNQGGVVSWFTGESSLANFADKLPALGKGLKGFSESVNGVNSENITAAANAAKALAEMTSVIPKEGGIKAWFSGETSISNFAGKLPELGKGLKGFSDSVAGINPKNVTAAADAANSLAQMLETMPKDISKISDFGTNLVSFGKKLKTYFTNMSEISAGSISASGKALDAVTKISELNAGNIKSVASAIKDLTTAVKNMAKDIKNDLKNAGKEAIEAFIKGINDKLSSATKACKSLVSDCADVISDKAGTFETAGKNLVKGFASGISENSYLAEAKARAMAKAAAKAAKEELDINSPSKVFRSIGTSVPEGFAQGISMLGNAVDASIADMSTTAVSGLKNSISRISDLVNADMDSEPVIRPVIDLSNVEAGMHTLGRMVNIGSHVGVLANVGAISAGMSLRGQNGDAGGTTNNSNVTNNTYIIDGVTYDDGSNVASAMEEIVHAAKVERRT